LQCGLNRFLLRAHRRDKRGKARSVLIRDEGNAQQLDGAARNGAAVGNVP
jgi:hypothetical protein